MNKARLMPGFVIGWLSVSEVPLLGLVLNR